MQEILEIKPGPKTWDGRVNWVYLALTLLHSVVISLLLFAVFVLLHTVHPITDEGWLKTVFGYAALSLFVLPCLLFILLMLREILGEHGVVINAVERRITEWKRNIFLRKTTTVFSFDDFTAVNAVNKSIKARYGYSHGFTVKLTGAEAEIEFDFYEELEPAEKLAKEISACLGLPQEREQNLSTPVIYPRSVVAITVVGLIMLGLSFLKTNQPASAIWCFRVFVLFCIGSNLLLAARETKRNRSKSPEL